MIRETISEVRNVIFDMCNRDPMFEMKSSDDIKAFFNSYATHMRSEYYEILEILKNPEDIKSRFKERSGIDLNEEAFETLEINRKFINFISELPDSATSLFGSEQIYKMNSFIEDELNSYPMYGWIVGVDDENYNDDFENRY
jgi:hypothetical protein